MKEGMNLNKVLVTSMMSAGVLVLAISANAQQITDPNLITLQHDFETEPPGAPPEGPFTLGNATFSEDSTGTGGPGWRLIAVWPGMGLQLTDNAGISDILIEFAVPVLRAGMFVGIGAARYLVEFFNGADLVGSVAGDVGTVEESFFAGWGHADGITSIRMTEPSGENGLVGGLDDVRYDAVPEPATIVALGLGLVIAATRRRR